MPTHFIMPKPRDWTTFEEIVNDVFSRKFENYNFQRYGRAGQAQDGVDIAGPLPSGDIIGVQCKHHPDRDISKTEIEEEIVKSEGFTPSLRQYVIATRPPSIGASRSTTHASNSSDSIHQFRHDCLLDYSLCATFRVQVKDR